MIDFSQKYSKGLIEYSCGVSFLSHKFSNVVNFRDDDDDDGDSPPPGTASITSFFAPKSDSGEHRRHQFFQERHLEPVESF